MTPERRRSCSTSTRRTPARSRSSRVLQSQIAMTPRGSYRTGAGDAPRRDARPRRARRAAPAASSAQGGNPLQAVRRRRPRPSSARRWRWARRRSISCAAPAARRRCSRTPRTPAPPRRWRSPPTPRSSGSRSASATTQTAQLAASIRADEEKMLERVLREIPKLTDAVVGADVEGDRPTTSSRRRGAAPTSRHRPARQGDQAHRPPGPQGPGRRAGRGPGQGRRRVRGRPRDRPLRHSSPPTRSSAGCPSSRRSTWPRSTPTSARTRTARRSSSRITALRGDEPWPGYDELTAAEVQAVLVRGRRRPRSSRSAPTSARTRTAPASSTPPSASSPTPDTERTGNQEVF